MRNPKIVRAVDDVLSPESLPLEPLEVMAWKGIVAQEQLIQAQVRQAVAALEAEFAALKRGVEQRLGLPDGALDDGATYRANLEAGRLEPTPPPNGAHS